jgi:hypothetical protein
MFEIPFTELCDLTPGSDHLSTVLAVYVKKPGTSYRDGQYLYGVYNISALTLESDDCDLIQWSARNDTLDDLIDLWLIYYNHGYTEFIEVDSG